MTRATCAAALRDEAETWVHLPAIRNTLRDLADQVEASGPDAALATAETGLNLSVVPAQVEAYQTALAMISECEDDE